MKKLLIVLSGVLFLGLISCEKENSVKNNKNELKEYFGELRTTLRSDFNQLEKNYKVYNDWIIAGEKIYEGNESALNSFRKNLNQAEVDLRISSKSASDVEGYQLNEINKIINSAEKYGSFEEYSNFLDERFEYFLNDSNLSFEDKLFTLTFLVNYSESLNFTIGYSNSITSGLNGYSTRGSWWSNWGKCATSILGGAITGATTLGLAGAAVGTVTMPLVGTISGGVIGTIGGGLGGAFTGAAAGC